MNRAIILAVAAALGLTGCASPATETTQTALAAESVRFEDAWVKAADAGMSSAFGQIHNSSTQDVTIATMSTTAAGDVEMHEMVTNSAGEMTMQEIDGGFFIPASGTVELAPGSNHVMLMGLSQPLRAGEEIVISVTFTDGSAIDMTVPVKEYAGANESYDGESDGELTP